jgi:hypothetical protein
MPYIREMAASLKKHELKVSVLLSTCLPLNEANRFAILPSSCLLRVTFVHLRHEKSLGSVIDHKELMMNVTVVCKFKGSLCYVNARC